MTLKRPDLQTEVRSKLGMRDDDPDAPPKGPPPLGGARTGLNPNPDRIHQGTAADAENFARVLASTAGIPEEDVDRAVKDFLTVVAAHDSSGTKDVGSWSDREAAEYFQRWLLNDAAEDTASDDEEDDSSSSSDDEDDDSSSSSDSSSASGEPNPERDHLRFRKEMARLIHGGPGEPTDD
jgi:hypothetical protein